MSVAKKSLIFLCVLVCTGIYSGECSVEPDPNFRCERITKEDECEAYKRCVWDLTLFCIQGENPNASKNNSKMGGGETIGTVEHIHGLGDVYDIEVVTSDATGQKFITLFTTKGYHMNGKWSLKSTDTTIPNGKYKLSNCQTDLLFTRTVCNVDRS